MIYTLLFFTGIIIALKIFFSQKYSYWKKRCVTHEEPAFLFGNLMPLIRGEASVGHCLANLYHKFNKPYFGFYTFWQPILVVKDLSIAKNILIKDFDNFRNRPFASDEKADPVAFHFLFIMKNQPWKNMRSKLSPIFTSGKLKLMHGLIKACTLDLDEYLKENIDETHEMKEVCAKFTTDTITSCAFGIKANSFRSENAEFRVAGRRIFGFNSISRAVQNTCYIFAPALVSLFRFTFIDTKAAEFLRGVFWENVAQRESGQIPKRNDLIDVLIALKNEDKDLLDGDALPAQAITFFAAGHETTSSAISFTLYELSLNEEVQSKLRKEVLESIEKHGDITYDAIQDMKYLSMVVSETLRKYPFAPFIARKAQEDYKVPGHDLTIEKNTAIFIPLHGLHYDPKYYPEPDKYDPERFSEENRHKIPPFAYLPFGDGPRVCIGERFGLLTTKLAIVHLIKEFEIIRAKETPDKLEFNPRSPLLVAKNGVPLKFKKYVE